MSPPGRALAVFWAVLMIAAGATVATLHVLGPIPLPASPAPAIAPAPEPLPEPAPEKTSPGPVALNIPEPEPAVPPPPPAAQEVPPPAATPPSVAAEAVSEAAVGPKVWDGHIVGPVADLLEPSHAFPQQNLPRIAADGRMPRSAYARPVAALDPRPRIGIIMSGIGQSEADSLDVIAKLPGAVTLAMSPYTRATASILAAARTRGHEFLLSIPMEPERLVDDEGPRALTRGASPDENRLNLEWTLSRFEGYAGTTGAFDNGMRGERFAAQSSSLGLALEEFARRGLFYVDPRPAQAHLPSGTQPAPLPMRAVDLVLDDLPARAEIQAKLATAERIARQTGSALVLAGPPRPVMLDLIAIWAQSLEERGYVLLPVSALVMPVTPHE